MKRALTTALQIAVTAALLWWIFRDPGKRAEMAAALGEASLWWYAPGVLCIGGVLLLQTQRWFLLLRALDISIGWLRCLRLALIGMFFNLFLFGATGGDVVKIFYAMRESKRDKAGAFLSIVLDRIIGLLALAFVSAVVVALQWQDLARSPVAQGLLATIALVLGGAVGVTVAGATVAILKLEHRLPRRMPMRRAIIDLAVATQRYARSPGTLVAAFLLSIPAHLLLFTSFYFAARAVTAQLTYANVLSVMPIVNVITALPISLSGVGVREQLFQNLLGQLHGTPEALAILIGMGGYLMCVAWSLAGGAVYLLYRPSDGQAATLKEMTAAAADVAEHPDS